MPILPIFLSTTFSLTTPRTCPFSPHLIILPPSHPTFMPYITSCTFYRISYTPNLFPFPHTLSHPSNLSYPHLSSIIHPLIHIAYFCTCMATPKSFQLPLITSQIHLPMCMGPMQTFPSSYPSSLFPYHYVLYAHMPLLSLPAAVLHVPIPLPLFPHACKAIIPNRESNLFQKGRESDTDNICLGFR